MRKIAACEKSPFFLRKEMSKRFSRVIGFPRGKSHRVHDDEGRKGLPESGKIVERNQTSVIQLHPGLGESFTGNPLRLKDLFKKGQGFGKTQSFKSYRRGSEISKRALVCFGNSQKDFAGDKRGMGREKHQKFRGRQRLPQIEKSLDGILCLSLSPPSHFRDHNRRVGCDRRPNPHKDPPLFSNCKKPRFFQRLALSTESS
jgi:hypothetical protein